MSPAHPRLSSALRWLLVVFGCASLELAQPMSRADPTPVAPPARAPDTVIFPGRGASAETPAPAAPRGSGRAGLLVACVGLGGAAWWWTRRRATGARPRRGRAASILVEETRPLGNRQFLVVATWEGRRHLLGVSPGQIQLLAATPSSADDHSDAPSAV